jgi:flagellar hook-associated protein 2
MASTASVSGLGSGLDTASLVSQLMQIEAVPRTRLQARLTSEKAELSALQSINSQVAALKQQAGALTSTSSWSAVTVTSSTAGVSAVATTSTTSTAVAAPGDTTVRVDQVARPHSLRFAQTRAGNDVVVPTGTVTLSTASGTRSLDVGSGSMNELVSAVNASGTGVVAGTVRLDDGTVRLTVRSATTGAGSWFELTDAQGGPLLGGAAVVAGQDARITVDGDTIASSSNTFVDVLGGLDLTVSAAAVGQEATLSVGRDTSAVTTSMKALVSSVNAVLERIDTVTANSATAGASGILAADSTLRGLRDRLVETVFGPGNASLAPQGITLDRSGRLVLDATQFAAAAAADPATMQQTVGGAGFVGRLATAAEAATRSSTGYLTAAVAGRQQGIDRRQDGIDAWTRRLEMREASLKATFVALETALARISSQSSWLGSQIAGLTSSSPS